jgi:hypothetical protein
VTSRLARLIRQGPTDAPAPVEGIACELCALAIDDDHRHLLDLDERHARCVCRACSILFDRGAAGGERYRLIPDRRRLVTDLALDDARWDDLSIPVGLAFFVRESRRNGVAAYYPGAMGATESLLGLEAWGDLERDNPVLRAIAPDVEALLVRRDPRGAGHWIVPVDDCFRLVAILRARWRGLAGGPDAWDAVRDFFDDLRRRSDPVDRRGRAIRPPREPAPLPAGTTGATT